MPLDLGITRAVRLLKEADLPTIGSCEAGEGDPNDEGGPTRA